jgi:uncharacterized protein (DUF58 family)
MDQDLGLDPALVQRLERLALVARQRTAGAGAGPRRSLASGSSVEFADYRTYAEGDDFRRVDWNAFARMDRLFLRVFEAEENTTVTIFVDCSASMAGGTPPKGRLAKQVAACLAYVALANYDRIAIAGIGDRLGPYLPPRSGRARAPEVWQFITDLPQTGATQLDRLAAFRGFKPAPGLAIVISDMLTPSDWRASMRTLHGECRQQVSVLQVLSPDELRPSIDGDWTLVDAETGQETDVSINPGLLSRYHQALVAHTTEVASWCQQHGMAFAQLASDSAIDEVVFRLLVRLGVAA